jgi:small conductance mechanosensitive channel
MDLQAHWQRILDWSLTSAPRILLILLATWIALKLARKLSTHLIDFIVGKNDDVEFQKRAQTLVGIARYIMILGISVVAALTILRELGIEIGPILAAAGIMGLAVGFGAQSLVKDVISGFFILLDDQIRVGDVVEIAGKSGLVEKVNLRVTVLRDVAGNVHYVPNGTIAVVTNMTKDYSRYILDVGVAYREDVDEVISVIKGIGEEMRNDPAFRDDLLEPLEVLGLHAFTDSAVIIRARTTTPPNQQWRVGREFNRRLKKRFDELGIEIPFPHMTLYMGQDKQGGAPPLRVRQLKPTPPNAGEGPCA